MRGEAYIIEANLSDKLARVQIYVYIGRTSCLFFHTQHVCSRCGRQIQARRYTRLMSDENTIQTKLKNLQLLGTWMSNRENIFIHSLL